MATDYTDYRELNVELVEENTRLYKENEELHIERDTLADEHIAKVNRIEKLEGDNETLQARIDQRIEDLETASDINRDLTKRIELASDAEHNRRELREAAIVLGMATDHGITIYTGDEPHPPLDPFHVLVVDRIRNIEQARSHLSSEGGERLLQCCAR